MMMKRFKMTMAGLVSAIVCSLVVMHENQWGFTGCVLGLFLFITFSAPLKLTVGHVSNLIFTLILTGVGWCVAFFWYVGGTFAFSNLLDFFVSLSDVFVRLFDFLGHNLWGWLAFIFSGFTAGVIGGVSVWLSYGLIKFEKKLKPYRSVIWIAGLAGIISSLLVMRRQSPETPSEFFTLGLYGFMPWQIIVFYWLSRFEPPAVST